MESNQSFVPNRTPPGRTIQPSSQAVIERALSVLSATKDARAAMDIPGRIALLDRIKQDMPGVEERWLAAGMAAKENQPGTYGAGVEWYSITAIYRAIRFLRKRWGISSNMANQGFPERYPCAPMGRLLPRSSPTTGRKPLHYRVYALKSGWTPLFHCKMAASRRPLFIKTRIAKVEFVLCWAQAISAR